MSVNVARSYKRQQPGRAVISAERTMSGKDVPITPGFLPPVGKPVPPPRQKAPPEVGFEGFRCSLQRLLERIDAATLEQKWMLVKQHLDTYHIDELGQRTAALVRDTLEGDGACDNPTRKNTQETVVALNAVLGLLAEQCHAIAPYIPTIRNRVLMDIFMAPPELPPPSVHVEQRYYQTTAKPFYQALRDLSAARSDNEYALEKEARAREKQCGILDRIITFWQSRYLERVVVGWRNALRHAKEVTGLQNELRRRAERAEQAIHEARQLRDDAAQVQTTWEEKLDKQKLQFERATRLYEQRIKELEAEKQDLAGQLEEARAAAEGRSGAEGECGVLRAIAQEALKGTATPHEMKLQRAVVPMIRRWCKMDNGIAEAIISREDARTASDQHSALRDEGMVSLDTLLQEWCADLTGDTFPTFDNAARSLAGIASVIHAVAPNLVSKEDLVLATTSPDDVERAREVTRLCDIIGVNPLCMPVRLAATSAVGAMARKQLLTAVLLRVLNNAGEGQPPFTSADGEENIESVVGDSIKDLRQSADLHVKSLQAIQRASDSVLSAMRGELLRAEVRAEVKLTEREKEEEEEYTTVTPDSLEGLLGPDEDPAEVCKDINSVLQSNYRILRQVFLFYGVADSKQVDRTLNRTEFEKFLGDCGVKISSKKQVGAVSRTQLTKLWSAANTDSPDDARSTLTPKEFITALARVAGIAVTGREGEPYGETFRHFIDEVVLPNASYASVEEFRLAVQSPAVQRVLRKFRSGLLKVFLHYAGKGDAEQTKEEQGLLQFSEFRRFVDDIKVVDEVCTYLALKQMFLHLHNDSRTELPSLDFPDFQQVLCALASFKNPAPYIPLYQKVAHLLAHTVLPPDGLLAAKLRIKL